MKLWWRNAFDTREGDAQGADEGTAHLLLAGEAAVFRNGAICPLVLWSLASVMNAGIFTFGAGHAVPSSRYPMRRNIIVDATGSG